MFDTSIYTIGWICALKTELVAARLVLDEEYRYEDYEGALQDNNSYSFGRMGKHNVVIAALPSGEYGTNNAATVARDLIRSFTNVRVALMVGIGGGAPLVEPGHRTKRDIRLGDVVVSRPGNGKGGVIQYDFGKAIQHREFQQTGHLDQPPAPLLTAITTLEADFELNGNGIHEDVTTILSSRPRNRKIYQRPEPSTDRLYTSTFEHPDDDLTCSEVCQIEEETIHRATRLDEEDIVIIHLGLIASGNSLMKDAITRTAFAQNAGVLCFEMEAAGLMNQFPCLVVRGICDYADTHKNKAWQGYAAMTAAVYAKRLLSRLAPNKVQEEVKLSDLQEIMQDVSTRINDVAMEVDKQTISALQTRIKEWLAAPDPSTNHNQASRLRHGDTGSWILESLPFQAWRQTEFSLLWLCGISGCGKTVLASTIIEYMKANDSDRTLLYFYFDTQDVRKKQLDTLLRSLIGQLCSAQGATWTYLERLYDPCSPNSSQPTTSALEKCFADMCSDSRIVIVLDALDESPIQFNYREDILTWIRNLGNSSNLSLLVTSRPELDIERGLAHESDGRASIKIEGQDVASDIHNFLRFCIYNAKDRLARWNQRPDIQDLIEKTLMSKCDGMSVDDAILWNLADNLRFRWAECQIEALKSCVDPRSVKKALQDLPKGLDKTYDRIIHDIPENQRANATRTLQFLVYSERPLRLEEIVDVLAVDLDHEPAFHEDFRMPDMLEVASSCSSLTRIMQIQADGENYMTLQLAHASVKDYLQDSQRETFVAMELQKSRAAECIMRVCLAYLSSASTAEEEILSALPLAHFAAAHWMDFTRLAERADEVYLTWVEKVLEDESLLQYSFRCYSPEINGRDGSYYYGPFPAALYIASLGGLTMTVERLIARGANVNEQGGYCGDALRAASLRGHIEAMKLLLSAGADPEAGEACYYAADKCALCQASKGGNVEAVQLLLDAIPVSSRTRPSQCKEALYAAAENAHDNIVEILLGVGTEVENNMLERAI